MAVCSIVSAQTITVSYRQGNLWGYADTLGNMIINPEYHDVNKGVTTTDALLVSRNNKWGVVSKKNGMIIPIKHDRIYDNYPPYFLTQDSNQDGYLNGLYTNQGKSIFPPGPYEFSWTNKRDIVTVRSTGKVSTVGMALLNSKSGRIEWIIPNIYKELNRNSDSSYIAETNTKRVEYLVSGSSAKKIKETKIDEPEYAEIVSMEEDRSSTGPLYEVKVTLSIKDSIVSGSKTKTLIKTQAWQHQKSGTPVITDCESIRLISYPNNHAEWIYFDQRRFVVSAWAIVRKNGKYGAYFATPKDTFIPCVYDSIGTDIIPLGCETILVKAKQNGKWGLLSLKNLTVTKFNFDEILFEDEKFYGPNYTSCFRFSDGLIVKTGERYNILKAPDLLAHATGFQDARSLKTKNDGIVVFDGSKKGLFREGLLFLPAYSGNGEFGNVSTSRYPLVEILGPDKKLIGYADRKGIVYFKD
jgi:hypothetical protein